ncbi:MAG: hypothetical protein QN152_05200 [Armatimonadota bacterium]|nr:hypothetical protein [Armatimonadota bacterium]MDR7427153.1 hypothetical protein [Armatimonadota bacterium]MDR7463981.1 hypothetical protein [Armatimonadota bacterium]MDR7470458.1 hypothetical protein [Armatimonadota bacterium]MDR7473564.1 hypothetical protein [Armatimonadota bacterium]
MGRSLAFLGLILSGLILLGPIPLGTVILLELSPARADPAFVLGASFARPPTFLPLRQAGVRTVKLTADWSAIEPARGKLSWADLDLMVETARRAGLQPVVVLTFTPTWASLAQGAEARDPLVATRMPPRQIADWERFVGAAVRRYRDRVRDWQVWTTPALPHFRGTASEYLALLVGARRASQAADPTSRIAAASPPGFDLAHVQRLITQAPDAVSIISLAPAGLSPERWLRPLAALRQRILQEANRALWLEWTPGAGLEAGALVRAVAVARAAGAERLFVVPEARQVEEAAGGILEVLQDMAFGGHLVRDPGVYALVFGAPDQAALLAWRTGDPAPLEVPVLAGARVLSTDGTAVASSGEGRVRLLLGPAPVLVSGIAPALVEEAVATQRQRGPLLPVVPPEEDYSRAAGVSLRPGQETGGRGLSLVPGVRGAAPVETVEVNGEAALRIPPGREAAFIYFDVDDTFLFFNDGRFRVTVTVETLGARAPQSLGFNLFYDARSGYRFTPWRWVEPGEGWTTQALTLEDASFATTAGWDFAINAGGNRREALVIRALAVQKVAR